MCEKERNASSGRRITEILSHPVVQASKGSIAGTVAKTIVYPLDRLKTTYQVDGARLGPFSVRRLVSTLVSAAYDEGPRALWKGNLAAIARSLPSAGIAFYAFDLYSDKLATIAPSASSSTISLLSGSAAGVTATAMTYPLDTWNTQMAITRGPYSYRELHQMAVKAEGSWRLRSCYRGLLPTLTGALPYAGTSFCTFTTLKRHRLSATGRSNLSSWESVIIGGFSGVVSQTVSYPIDTIRKRVQAYAIRHGRAAPSVWQIANELWVAQNMRGFLNGVSINWIKAFLAAGTSFAINEQLKHYAKPF